MTTFQQRTNTPPAVLNLLIANGVAFLATLLLNKYTIYEHFALFPVGSPFFEPWQVVSYMFLPRRLLAPLLQYVRFVDVWSRFGVGLGH